MRRESKRRVYMHAIMMGGRGSWRWNLAARSEVEMVREDQKVSSVVKRGG